LIACSLDKEYIKSILFLSARSTHFQTELVEQKISRLKKVMVQITLLSDEVENGDDDDDDDDC
jgi:hypothetical protein